MQKEAHGHSAVTSGCAAKKSYDIVTAMRRAQAILVIVALLSTPLALLARSNEAGMSGCTAICCVAHGARHSAAKAPAENSSAVSQQEGMSCHHDAVGHKCECAMKSGSRQMAYGLAAPFPPVTASMIASIEVPKVSRSAKFQIFAGNLSSGFLADPFQPPRS